MARLTDPLPERGPMQPGDVLSVPVRDRTGAILKTVIVVRTTRDFAFDLCDAYNAARTADAIDRGLAWFVSPTGELKLGIADDWSRENRRQVETRNETERAIANRRQLEAARNDPR